MSQLPPKKDVAQALLKASPSVFVHLDPRKAGVSVPKWFTGKPQLVLQIGFRMAVPIRDLEVTDEGIGGTLSFNRSPFFCFMPWSAIYGLVAEDGRGMVWPEDVPAEVSGQAKKRPSLKVVEDTAGSDDEVPSIAPPAVATAPLEADAESEPEPEAPRPKLALVAEGTEPEEAGENTLTAIVSIASSRPEDEIDLGGAPEGKATPEPMRTPSHAPSPAAALAAALPPQPPETEASPLTVVSSPPPVSEPSSAEAAEPTNDGESVPADGKGEPEVPTDPDDNPDGSGGGAGKSLPPYLRVVK